MKPQHRFFHQLFPALLAIVLSACSGGNDNDGADPEPVNSSSSSSLTNQSSAVSSESSSQSSLADASCSAGKHIVGYFPSWRGEVADIQYPYLTHILYSFLLPNNDGSLKPMEQASVSKLQALVNHARGEGVKVGIAIGGWNDGDDSAFVALASNPATRAVFVSAVIDFVVTYNLDGVDMDWEYPSTLEQANHYTALMGELRTALDELEGNKFLTAAVIAQGSWNGQYIQNAVFDSVDFLNIMAYDENNAEHSSLDYAATSIAYWNARGLPRAKIVLGVPFYARPSWASYKSYVTENPENACRDSVDSNHYNGIPTIRTKSAYINSEACGVMMWELSQDTNNNTSLLRAIWEVVNNQEPSYSCQ